MQVKTKFSYMSNNNLEGEHAICLPGWGSQITSLVCFTALTNSFKDNTQHKLSTPWPEIQCAPKCGTVTPTYFSDNISNFSFISPSLHPN